MKYLKAEINDGNEERADYSNGYLIKYVCVEFCYGKLELNSSRITLPDYDNLDGIFYIFNR